MTPAFLYDRIGTEKGSAADAYDARHGTFRCGYRPRNPLGSESPGGYGEVDDPEDR